MSQFANAQDAQFEQTFPGLKEALDRNNTGLAPSSVPALVMQGATDPIVPARTAEIFVSKLCAASATAGGGGSVTYISYPGVHHFQARQVGFKDTLAWMQTVMTGGAPRSACGPGR